MSTTEKELLRQAQNGSIEAFEELVRQCLPALYPLVFRYMQDHGRTDDVLQDSLVKAHKALESFRAESTFKSWLTRIAINTAKNALRSKQMRPMVDIEQVQIEDQHRDFGRLESQQTRHLLTEIIEKLPPKQRQALELRIYEDLSFKEIAELMQAPFDTAKANFRHALISLRKLLESHDDGRVFEELKLSFADMVEDKNSED